MGTYGLTYDEYLESVSNPDKDKFAHRYAGRIRPDPVIKSDADLIREFLDERISSAGIVGATAKAEAGFLCSISRSFPDFKKMNTKTASSAFSSLRHGMKQNSARRAMQVFRTFIQWMHDEKINTNIDLEKIKKIRSPAPNYDTKKASDMLTGKEVNDLISACKNDRDRAIISLLYEGSLRPIEIISATWGDLNFDRYGAQFTTSKKTGKPRYIRLILAAPYLLKWKNNYPGKITNDSPLFVSAKRPTKALTRPGLKTIFDVILSNSNIDKKISPYYLRHSRITAMQREEIPDSVIKLQAWGSVRSNMLATYSHLVNNDVDRILLTRAGIVTEMEKENDDSLKSRQCPNCGKIHTPTTKFCDDCGTGLTKEAKDERQMSLNKVRELAQNMTKEQLVEAMSIALARGK